MSKITLFIALIGSLTLTYHIEAQTTAIPDANFEQALIDLGIDSDGVINGQVLTADIQSVTSLDVSEKGIINLTGIQDFDSLEVLYCQNNLLQSLNISENAELQIVDCSFNMISGLFVRNNLKLKSLTCSSNNIGELNVSFNTELEQLYVDKNQLTTLNVQNNKLLKVLNCASNQLAILNVTDNWELVYLDISFNYLTLINLINSVRLEYLDCSYNPLFSLVLDNQINLKTIRSIENNLLTDIDFNQNFNLEHITCYNNDELRRIEINGAKDLRYLNCRNNQLVELDVSQNTLLESLYCQNNRLSALDLSLNQNLAFLKCNDNILESLDLRNGQNALMTGGLTEYDGVITYIEGLNATNNVKLQCIDVDDETAANAGIAPYDSWLKDDATSYSEDCQSFLGVDDYLAEHTIHIYPNPAHESVCITADQQIINRVVIYSVLGKETKEVWSDFGNIGLQDLNSGLYFMSIQLEHATVFKRLIKE